MALEFIYYMIIIVKPANPLEAAEGSGASGTWSGSLYAVWTEGRSFGGCANAAPAFIHSHTTPARPSPENCRTFNAACAVFP
ncbi:jg6169 [Pararge aegeria aegeria]|uniref:Jg6169 protein n=1 Tax=Pararge aegeria aegeria TaxID=348720 RepID=A0A8S4RNW1_9NEOP|nr:jg6169 [Pararge aegeria aegeria]